MSAVHSAAKKHLHHIGEYLKHWDMDVQVVWTGKAYAATSNYTHLEGSLGGIIYEGADTIPWLWLPG